MKRKWKEELNLLLRIMSTHAVMRSQIIAEKLGINPTDLESIEVLLREGKITAGRLAQETGLTTGAITGVIDRLVRAGYAAREEDPGDRRKVLVALNVKRVEEDVVPLYESISRSTEKILRNYS
ncbi:MarR family transcriptional regulator [bacterium]|nr:MAG: MarR family transcriptional regulator [bacterium]